jgi:SAM-dependent methyltransferase
MRNPQYEIPIKEELVEKIVRDWDYWAYLFRVTHRDSIAGIEAYDEQLVAFIMAALELEPGDEVLDLACGSGVHGVRLGRAGLGVTGVDISPSLVAHANELVKEKEVEGVAFIVGDMREPPCASAFDAVTILSHSFGFFGPEDDMTVLRAIRAALQPGGRFLLDLNESAELRQARKGWQELDGGFLLNEAQYDPVTCVRTATFRYIDCDGRLNVAEEPETIRIYSLPELTQMIAGAGMQLEAVYGRMALPLTPYGADCRERRLVVGRRA